MSGSFLQRKRFNHMGSTTERSLDAQYEQTTEDASSSEDKVMTSFPFLTTPSGNLKVVPQQVVYESKQLSIVAADPRRTKVNIKSDNNLKDMSGDKRSFHIPAMEILSKMESMPPRFPLRRPDADSPSDEGDLFADHSRGEPQPLDKRQQGTCTIAQLQHEIKLSKMGFSPGPPVDWTKVELPPKTDLHKLLHYRISNYIHPDILIKIGNHEYRCHLLVLQCYSSFFVEKPTTRIEIDEKFVTKQAFAYIYDWMLHLGGDSYTLLRRDNILEIFMAAQHLQVKELEEQCWAFIDNEDLFSEDKAFMLYLDARAACNTAVMELMVPRIQRFFLTLVSSKDFLEMTEPEVCVFLRSNYICIHCEMEVFMSGVRWLMFDWENRKESLVEIMKCVRFGLVSPWQLVDIRRNPENQEFLLVTRHPDVSRMIEDGLAFAIIKYWYGHDSAEYGHWIENLGLAEPTGRNWAGTYKINDQKKYNTYQEFLADLAKYRQMHLLSNKGQGDKGRLESRESLMSEFENARNPMNASDFIVPQQRNQ